MRSIEENKKLIEKYWWLLPRNRWTDKIAEDYDYSYTELDAMPDGWREKFGMDLCEEINNELNKLGEETKKDFRITQIKEKYGSLRFYTNWGTKEIYEIISKYEKLSETTCIDCGRPAKYISTGWISPYCEECKDRIKNYENFITIKEYFEEDKDE